MELDYSGHLQTGDAELLMPESRNSDVKLKFIGLSQVLKVTATQQPTIAISMARSSHPAKDWQAARKFHKVPDHEKVAASPNSAASQTGKQLLEVGSQLLCLNLSGLNDRNCSSRSPKSEPKVSFRWFLLFRISSVTKKIKTIT